MSRVVSIFLPTWPTDRLLRVLDGSGPPDDAPLILARRDGNKRVIHALNKTALVKGLRVGMPVSQAQAMLPALNVAEADLEADSVGLDKLAAWALRHYSPVAAADHPDGLVIDATGAAHLHGGEAAMLDKMVARLGDAGIIARVALADTWGAAHALARYAKFPRGRTSLVVPPEESTAQLSSLPVQALRLPALMVDQLNRLGFERIGDLAAQPRAPLARRFGPELYLRLDQALGTQNEMIEPARLPELIEVRRHFAEPISAPETLNRYTAILAAELCGMLEARTLGARKLDLIFQRVDNQIEAIRVGTAAPVHDVKRLTRLLCDKIETIDPGFGVDVMSLRVPIAEPFVKKQLTSLLVEESSPDISDLIDTLANRVGEHNIYRIEPVESDVPERSVKRVPPLSPPSGKGWHPRWARPARLLDRPEPIDTVALLPDHPPVAFTWKGRRRKIKRADGPERVFAEWWKRCDEAVAVRDYFQVEDELGERFWIFRAGDGEDPSTGSHAWFLHGFFG
jgi:protein ImuB